MRLALKILRILAGLVLLFAAGGLFIEGGFSRYARYGLPPHTDWRFIALGVLVAAGGAFLIRPNRFLHRPLK